MIESHFFVWFPLAQAKFDDYYEFEVGNVRDDGNEAESFSRFSIVRPMKEGVRPTTDNGFAAFADVRGDSGTKVTIRLNEKAVGAGLLEEQKLKPIFAHILETSQYTVAFSSDDDALDIIDASRKEDEDAATSQDKGELIEPLDASSVNALDLNGRSKWWFALVLGSLHLALFVSNKVHRYCR